MSEDELFLEIGATTSGNVNVSVPGVWSKRMLLKEAETVLEILEDAIRLARINSENTEDRHVAKQSQPTKENQ